MAITIKQIIQRIKELHSDSENGEDVTRAINYLRRNAEAAHEYIEFLRKQRDRRVFGSKVRRPKLIHKLWKDYEERIIFSSGFHPPSAYHFQIRDSPPGMIRDAIETLINEETYNKLENIDPEPKKTPAAEPSKESYSDQEHEQSEDRLDASSNRKPKATKPFELKGQVMCFSDGTRETLNETEAKFVKIIIDRSKQGLMADADAFKDTIIYDRRAIIRAEIKKKYPRTSELIKSKRGKRGYCIPKLFLRQNNKYLCRYNFAITS